MLLNRKYYQELWDKYQNIETLTAKLNDNISILTIKIILDQYKNKKPIHFNFQNPENPLQKIGQNLFIELANNIFHNEANFPLLKIGDKVKSKNLIRVGTPMPRFLTFIIKRIKGDKYILENSQFSINWERSFSDIVQKFTPITQNAQNDTLTQYASFFENLNGKQVHDFTPTYFERKSVFIAPKTFYDSLEVKNKIPTTYFLNPREENNPHETKSIPALPLSSNVSQRACAGPGTLRCLIKPWH